MRVKTWQERLFELIKRGHGYVACPGGTGTLVELAVVWEMLNKGAMSKRPLVVLGDFWQPVIERVREVELGHPSRWGESGEPLVHTAPSLPMRPVTWPNIFRRAEERHFSGRADFPQLTGIQLTMRQASSS